MLDFIFWAVVVFVVWQSFKAFRIDRKVSIIENYRNDKMEAINGHGEEGQGPLGSNA